MDSHSAAGNKRRRPIIPCRLVILGCALALATITPAAWPQEPAPGLGGEALLAEAQLPANLRLSIYGPEPLTLYEPSLLTVLIQGAQTPTVDAGMVVLACPEDAVELRYSPPPAGWFIPFGQWSPDRESEWREFLIVNPRSLCCLPIISMAHVGFLGGAGELLDFFLMDPKFPMPEEGSIFRNNGSHDHIGVAFVSDTNLVNLRGVAGRNLQEDPGPARHGAHGVRFNFPVVFNQPEASVGVWVMLKTQDKYLTQTVMIDLSAPRQRLVTREADTPAPVISAPAANAKVSGSLDVSGKTLPGTLAVAWVEIYAAADPNVRIKGEAARRISDDTGRFNMTVALPASRPAADSLSCELHVRSEAPGYKSPETVINLELAAQP